MVITKGISISTLIKWSLHHVIWLLIVMGGIATLYYFEIIKFNITWLPISVIGTAVAFYVGFKNNQAYDRMWEARKIWGGIVNESRTWGMMVDGFITNQFAEEKADNEEIHAIKKRLIYRHIGWLYSHRSQLLVSTSWEHINQGGNVARYARYYQQQFGVGLVDDEVTKTLLAPLEHNETRIRVNAERAMNRRLEGGCQVPIGAFALVDGEQVDVIIDISTKRTGLQIPNKAVVYRDQRPVVFTEKDGLALWNYVTLGERFGNSIEIVGGVSEGDHIITKGHFTLAHQANVSFKTAKQ